MLWYEVAGKILYYITLPVVKTLLLVSYVLRIVLSPFIYIAQVLVQLCLIPYNVAARFEVQSHMRALSDADSNRLCGISSAAPSSSVLSSLSSYMAYFEPLS